MATTMLDVDSLVSGKRFMVTGAAGFIGGHLVAALGRLGAERIVALDREPLASNSFLRAAQPSNVNEVRLALGDTSPEALRPLLADVDAVFHLAAVKYRPDGEPLFDIMRSNVLGTAALLQALPGCRRSKLVFASSLYAYGRMRGEPFDEGEDARPSTVYGHSKRVVEDLLTLVNGGSSSCGFTALRYMFVYGPGQSPKHGYPSVIVKNFSRMLSGQRPLIHGDGSQVLDYVFVDDVVQATIRALRPEGDGRIYNVGSGQGISIRELTTLMREVAGFGGDPEFLPPDRTAGTNRVARIERIRDDLGWGPVTPLRSGLGLTLASIRQHRDWYAQGVEHVRRS
jgi:nucleoside-diphosphate-sugar epimerase